MSSHLVMQNIYEGLAMLATLTLKSWQSLLSITPVEKQLFC